jgi:hypothetical protein
MANHGRVRTRKKLTPAGVSAIIERLNQERFQGRLLIESCKGGWGQYTWEIKVRDEPGEEPTYGSRICWIETPNRFEMRHGGGGRFWWWLDAVIQNEVALEFNGTLSDDGHDGKWKPEKGKYPTYRSYCLAMLAGMPGSKFHNRLIRLFGLQDDERQAPEAFRRKWRYLILAETKNKHMVLTAKKLVPPRKVSEKDYHEMKQ